MEKLLEIKNVKTIAEDDNDKHILNGLDLTINKGEIHVIMGPNGAGKSTLANTILGSPKYIVTDGSIIFEGKNINELKTCERANLGIFMSFQNAVEIPGITIAEFIKSSVNNNREEKIGIYEFIKKLTAAEKSLNIDESYSHRDLNVGFSGGEKKKSEILQLLMLNPKLALLDETDSGLDIDALKTVVKGIKEYKNENNSILIITHSIKMIEDIDVDYVHILVNGKIVKTGDKSLAYEIEKNGFKEYIGE